MILKKKLHQHLIKIGEKLISCVTIFWNETKKLVHILLTQASHLYVDKSISERVPLMVEFPIAS